MKFRSGDDYIEGAGERLHAAQLLYRQSRYVEAIYFAGVAVECVLRAYLFSPDKPFDARHDLDQMLQNLPPDALETLAGHKRREIAAAIGDVWARWKNSYRYGCSRMLCAEMKRLELHRSKNGDALEKACAATVMNGAFDVVTRGVMQWSKK